MTKIFLTYGAVPELAPLSKEKRIEVIRASGGRFGKTALFRRVWLLGVVLSFVIPAIIGVIVYLWQEDFRWSCWSFIATGLLGYSLWFHIRTSCLRPHIRAYLAENENIKT